MIVGTKNAYDRLGCVTVAQPKHNRFPTATMRIVYALRVNEIAKPYINVVLETKKQHLCMFFARVV